MTADTSAAELQQIESRRLAAIVGGDREGLDLLHADSFLLCTPGGQVWDKQHYNDGLVDGSIHYHRFEPVSPIEATVDARLGVVRYRSRIEISLDGNSPRQLECWHLDVYEREADGPWRCRWSQATNIA